MPREEQLAVAAGQIPAPDAAGEEHVAAEEDARLLFQETKAAGAVARDEEDLEIDALDRQRVAFHRCESRA